jgi:hypothetical protein
MEMYEREIYIHMHTSMYIYIYIYNQREQHEVVEDMAQERALNRSIKE